MKNNNLKTEKIRSHFKRNDPMLFSILNRMETKLLKGDKDADKYFSKLCREIISQQLASKAAHAIHSRFLELFTNRRVAPRRVLEFSEKELRATGMSWAKARYVRDLAQKVLSRQVQLSKLSQWDNEAAIKELTKVKGIGRWTAEMFLIFTLGREDVFSLGDLGLRKGLTKIYGKSRTKSEKNIEKITNTWSPYRSYGSLALWHVLDAK